MKQIFFEKPTDDGPPFVVKWFEKSGGLYFRLLPKIASNAVAILDGIGSPFSQPLSHCYQPSQLNR